MSALRTAGSLFEMCTGNGFNGSGCATGCRVDEKSVDSLFQFHTVLIVADFLSHFLFPSCFHAATDITLTPLPLVINMHPGCSNSIFAVQKYIDSRG